ncbi:T9SS type A sorting domain-containing protein [candidate division WOR-3 bacterium]|nr:T9SS type A sorting domain-containing protein [candidate division WOR-3 bacterium]
MKEFKLLFICFFVVVGMIVPARNGVLAATATVDTSEVHQTMEGFGASVAWEVWQLYSHDKNSEVYNYLFNELGLDILRLRNVYSRGEDYIFGNYESIVDSFYAYSDPNTTPKIIISSWTPPTDLKSNNNLVGGTLDKIGGEYVYGDFVQYWMDALAEFEEYGIVPDYISIQNEPDWGQDHATCRFGPTENTTYAGYDQALDSLYHRVQELSPTPKILGPEVLGIDYNNFQNYATQFNQDYVDGYAYHLYHGNNTNPDDYITRLSAIANNYKGKPIFQTEFDRGGWFNTAWLMHNCLVHGNVSGYLYWWSVVGSFTPENPPLITLNGSTAYTMNQIYWAFRQYSKAIHSGWKRVGASVDEDSLKISAFVSPGNDELSIIILNVSHSENSVDLNVSDFNISGANMLRTSEEEKCDYIGNYNGSAVDLPARSITTISTLYIEDVSGIEEEDYDSPAAVCLSQNYPNPFSASTTIEYSIADAGFVKLSIYDISGREVETLVEEVKPAGKYTVNIDAKGLSQGVYFYRLKTSGNSLQKKMILLK